MTGLRVLLRLAIRDARRDRGRSLLVLAMVALPVAGLVATITFGDSVTPTEAQRAVARLGAADATATPAGPRSDVAAFVASLPPGVTAEPVTRFGGTVIIAGVVRAVDVTDAGLTAESLSAGRLNLVEGRSAQTSREVAVSRAVAQAAGVGLGDSIDVEPLGTRTITGVVLDPQRLSRNTVVAPPASLAGSAEAGQYDTSVLLGRPDSGSGRGLGFGPLAFAIDGTVAPPDGWLVQTRAQVLREARISPGERTALIVVGGLACVEVALVAGAAFAVSVRRRQRELGLLAAAGATARQVRASVLLVGVTVGLVGAVAGVTVGILGAWGLTQTAFIERVLDRQVTGLLVDPLWVVSCAAMGAGAAFAGAWWPSRTVARLPVLTALSGRRPVPKPSRRTAIWGLVIVALGAAAILPAVGVRNGLTPFVFTGGSILVVLGTGLTSPFLLEQLARVAGRLPTGPRLALRDAARFRTRNGPIVTAAMARLAASITVAAGLGTAHANKVANHVPSLPPTMAFIDRPGQVIDAASTNAAAAMDAEVHRLTLLGGELRGTGELRDHVLTVFVVSPQLAGELGGSEAAEALKRGRLVSLDGSLSGSWELFGLDSDTGERLPGAPLTTLEAAVPPSARGATYYPALPAAIVSADVAGLAKVTPLQVWERRLLIGDEPFTEAQVAAAGEAVSAVGDELLLDVDQGPDALYQRIQWAATLIGALAGLLIVVVAIALAATEARSDLRTLTAVGAGARTRRSVAAGRALLLSGLGGILAVPVGMVPALAVLSIAQFIVPVVIPWGAIAIVALGVPAVTTIGAVIAASMNRDPLARHGEAAAGIAP